VLAGPTPAERKVDANPFTGASLEIILDGPSAAFHDHDHEGELLASGSGAAAPQSPLAAPRAIELLGAESWDVVSTENVRQAMALLPGWLQQQLGNPSLGPIRILVNFEGRTSSGYQPYGRAANFFSTNEGHNEVVLYPQQSVFTIVHELGHAYNLRRAAAGNYASVLIDPEMQSFMAAAGWQVLTRPDQVANLYDHAQVAVAYSGEPVWTSMSRNDPLEDFANSFALYFVNPGELGSRSPARYAWFAKRFGP
jgi:hypothetical protein